MHQTIIFQSVFAIDLTVIPTTTENASNCFLIFFLNTSEDVVSDEILGFKLLVFAKASFCVWCSHLL